MVTHIKNFEEFNAKLSEAGNTLVVVDFFATWCGPCKIIAPKVEEMAQEMTDVIFLSVDVDDCEDIAMAYQINVMPTFIFIKEGKVLETISGGNPEKLKNTVLSHK